MSNELVAKFGREFHLNWVQRWAFSDLNPWLQWLGPAAEMVKSQRQPADEGQPFVQIQGMVSELMSASLDYYRDLRDAASEAQFFQTYGSLFSLYLADKREAEQKQFAPPSDARQLPFVKEALDSIAEGGYAEALCRAGYLLARKGEPLPLTRFQLKQEMMEDYRDLLPELAPDQRRRIRGEQEIICRYEPEQAIATLPKLLADRADRKRFLTLADKLLADKRLQAEGVTAEQVQMMERIRGVLQAEGGSPPRLAPVKKSAG